MPLSHPMPTCNKQVQSHCISPDRQCPAYKDLYPYRQFDRLLVLQQYFLLEVAGIDGGLLIFIKLILDIFDSD